MIIPALAEFFKYKVVSSIIVLTCSWGDIDRIKFSREVSHHGMSTTFSCDPGVLNDTERYRFQGVIYIKQRDDSLLEKVKREHFSMWFKWLVISDADDLPKALHKVRYDADVTLLQMEPGEDYRASDLWTTPSTENVFFDDVYVHPRDGATAHLWAVWSEITGFHLIRDREKILRRMNLKKYRLKIASPVGLYSTDWYNGTFKEYIMDETMPERDSSVRSGYLTATLIVEMVNSTEELQHYEMWNSMEYNDSMLYQVSTDQAQISGAILRILTDRIDILDFVVPIWPFIVGFTFLAERESSSNMFVEPFSAGVWWCCLGIGVVLALAQRVTAKKPEEKEGAYMAVMATCLQQDASAVPNGPSGRWCFTVLSISSMLVHAYYTSAIVSALMSGGSSGPDTLRALGDSRYAIASEDYQYQRHIFWDVDSKWDELEYLKKKKMTSKFYQEMERGVELIRAGDTAYHTEYNQLYPHLKTFTDDQLCKIKHVDTIPEVLAWVSAAKGGQWTSLMRSRGAWLHETGLAKRLVSHLRIRPPPCRSALLAERVKIGDVASLIGLTALGGVASGIVLAMEIFASRFRKEKKRAESVNSEKSLISNVIEYVE